MRIQELQSQLNGVQFNEKQIEDKLIKILQKNVHSFKEWIKKGLLKRYREKVIQEIELDEEFAEFFPDLQQFLTLFEVYIDTKDSQDFNQDVEEIL